MHEAENESTAAERVGKRIRMIRESQHMTQAELGSKIGLTADRIQKYENGKRKPLPEMQDKIAQALNVSPRAIDDPDVTNYIGATYVLFEMERLYGLKVEYIEGQRMLILGNEGFAAMDGYLEEWGHRTQQLKIDLSNALSDQQRKSILHAYDMWKWNYPNEDIKAMKIKI